MPERRAMPEPEREPGQNGAAAPFVSIEKPRSVVEVSALGEDRFRITAPGHEWLVTGFEEAQLVAQALTELR